MTWVAPLADLQALQPPLPPILHRNQTLGALGVAKPGQELVVQEMDSMVLVALGSPAELMAASSH